MTDKEKFIIAHAHLMVALDRLKEVDKMPPGEWKAFDEDIASIDKIIKRCRSVTLHPEPPERVARPIPPHVRPND